MRPVAGPAPETALYDAGGPAPLDQYPGYASPSRQGFGVAPELPPPGLPVGHGQEGGEWWRTPGTYPPPVTGYGQPGVDGRRQGVPVARTPGRTARTPLLDRAIVAFAAVLAGYAVTASVIGVKANPLFPGSEWMSHRILAVTAVHVAVALLWVVAAVLFGRRVKAGRALVGVLAVGYLGMNAIGLYTSWRGIGIPLAVFTGSVDYVCLATDWYGCPPYGENAGLRFTGTGAVLSGLMVILLLVSAIRTRRRSASPQLPVGGYPVPVPPPGYPAR
ncbi:hypothetical protein ACIO52_10190 [Nocardia sp. NPDC087230]|uniref:hypothetical protein n=1 Tax=Nocardia sp. NPDC087230 TaxID=3364331 RepID=UPI003825B735